MENTGLTMGRDKNVPFRVLVLGFGLLFVQLRAASLAALLGYRGVSAGWGVTQVQVKVGCGESELFGDALEQGSEVRELGMSFSASFCQAKEGRGLK